MKQRLCGKIIKHKERYSATQVLMAYERSVRSLRKYYMRQYEKGKGITNYYVHQACKPFYMMQEDVDELWCVKEGQQ